MKWLTRIDHVTFVVTPATMKKWAWWYLEKMGGKLILRVDDTNPTGKSSMMLWCIDYGEFGIALSAGIDREEKSHVTAFAERHGDHSVQHVAFQVPNLAQFSEQMSREAGLAMVGPSLQRRDAFGWVRQVFAKAHHDQANPAEVPFTEYVERTERFDMPFADISFSAEAGTNLFQQAQDAMAQDDREPMLDFTKMPADWEPPTAKPKM